ncbi:hypothetical protein [Nonomuraea sediminis]|uniref:hypothetical protein n=1 Tax=Nonomuraea sediminis TaxID=2835864 RepID=UPI001BDCAC04|nr:hypothetical protein [Nonomuraea sediminis]
MPILLKPTPNPKSPTDTPLTIRRVFELPRTTNRILIPPEPGRGISALPEIDVPLPGIVLPGSEPPAMHRCIGNFFALTEITRLVFQLPGIPRGGSLPPGIVWCGNALSQIAWHGYGLLWITWGSFELLGIRRGGFVPSGVGWGGVALPRIGRGGFELPRIARRREEVHELLGFEEVAGGGGQVQVGPAAFRDGSTRGGSHRLGRRGAEQRHQHTRALPQAFDPIDPQNPQRGQHRIPPIPARPLQPSRPEPGPQLHPRPGRHDPALGHQPRQLPRRRAPVPTLRTEHHGRPLRQPTLNDPATHVPDRLPPTRHDPKRQPNHASHDSLPHTPKSRQISPPTLDALKAPGRREGVRRSSAQRARREGTRACLLPGES